MEFQTETQKAVYEKIIPWLKEIFGEHFTRVRDDAPIVNIYVGSALAQVGVFAWGDKEAIINTRSYVVSGAEITQDLMQYLLRENTQKYFGAFGLEEGNHIVFEHCIVGSTCDKEELKASVVAVAMTADDYDDKIVARWGGQRMLDRLQ
ncbi:MAG TPA: YbjN domain-containing protein [Blastocatellia bacterium]|nr:YbjN domain-containing protein [Blastocatellia bacterium]